jgi:hypothetical protein
MRAKATVQRVVVERVPAVAGAGTAGTSINLIRPMPAAPPVTTATESGVRAG